ncbi:2-hydroxychromene-2-carboxylate isomerase [Granulosicoccus antarcticus]|uniref:2-hydroxychromene-2-carboxylate isomerase n=1 Tax=Granulosicoccus antarcticus IMCC3135 TaxID=1192854 RepID=A0A2Z2PA21_9GAMM|nr:2-hydroxychromene-2-carboxylate isomerase [Granulosicoccus antarcticus]ASJ76734.1 2-hydroxychromene-2-carboxylate isomerase [Granulosicoccus antarcticus IMCC3135]
MSKTVDYYHFLISPWSYLALNSFNSLKQRTGVTVNYLPIDVGSTFANMGGVPPAKRHPSRQRLRMDELKRWSEHLNVPINLTPAFFPADQTLAACMVYAATPEQAATLSDAFLVAVWRDEKNIADTDTLIAIANECGIDGAALLAAADNDAMRQKLTDVTADAHAKDVFGSPTYSLDGELFWGQDRLDFLERAILK